jgi:hypothetical protein
MYRYNRPEVLFLDYPLILWNKPIQIRVRVSKKRQQRANALANSNAARKRKSRTKEAIRKRRTRKWKQWKTNQQILEAFSGELKNPPGSSRSTAENKILLLAVRATVRRVLASAKIENIMTISWHSIEEEVARDF